MTEHSTGSTANQASTASTPSTSGTASTPSTSGTSGTTSTPRHGGGYSRGGSTGGSGGSTGGGYRFNKRRHPRKKVCRFCENKTDIDYKDAKLLKSFLTERGKILPKRATGNCDRHQRQLTRAIKTSRTIALIPYGLIVQK